MRFEKCDGKRLAAKRATVELINALGRTTYQSPLRPEATVSDLGATGQERTLPEAASNRRRRSGIVHTQRTVPADDVVQAIGDGDF